MRSEVPPPYHQSDRPTAPIRQRPPIDEPPPDARAAERALHRKVGEEVLADPHNAEYLDRATTLLREIKKSNAATIDLTIGSDSPNMTPEENAAFNAWVKRVQSGEPSVYPPSAKDEPQE